MPHPNLKANQFVTSNQEQSHVWVPLLESSTNYRSRKDDSFSVMYGFKISKFKFLKFKKCTKQENKNKMNFKLRPLLTFLEFQCLKYVHCWEFQETGSLRSAVGQTRRVLITLGLCAN